MLARLHVDDRFGGLTPGCDLSVHQQRARFVASDREPMKPVRHLGQHLLGEGYRGLVIRVPGQRRRRERRHAVVMFGRQSSANRHAKRLRRRGVPIRVLEVLRRSREVPCGEGATTGIELLGRRSYSFDFASTVSRPRVGRRRPAKGETQ